MAIWADFKFPPINLWNLPLQYRDIDESEIEDWHNILLEYGSEDIAD